MENVRLFDMQVEELLFKANPAFDPSAVPEELLERRWPEGEYSVDLAYSVSHAGGDTFRVRAEMRAEPGEGGGVLLGEIEWFMWLEVGLTLEAMFRVDISHLRTGNITESILLLDSLRDRLDLVGDRLAEYGVGAVMMLADIACMKIAELTAMTGRESLQLPPLELDAEMLADQIASNLGITREPAEKPTPKKKATKPKAATKKGSKTPRKTS